MCEYLKLNVKQTLCQLISKSDSVFINAVYIFTEYPESSRGTIKWKHICFASLTVQKYQDPREKNDDRDSAEDFHDPGFNKHDLALT